MAKFDQFGVEFSEDGKTLVKCPTDYEGEYVIPEGVTQIGDHAFKDCMKLTNVTIPNSVKSIGELAFYGCICLHEVTIPEGVTTIGGWAFDNCRYLASVTLPNSIESIGILAFGEVYNGPENIYVPKGQKARFAQMEGLSTIKKLMKSSPAK